MLSKRMNNICNIITNNLNRVGIPVTLSDLECSGLKPFAYTLRYDSKNWEGTSIADNVLVSLQDYTFERNKHKDIFRISITYKKKFNTEGSCYFMNLITGDILYIDDSMPALFCIGEDLIGIRYYSSVSGKTTGSYIYYNNKIWRPIEYRQEKIDDRNIVFLAPEIKINKKSEECMSNHIMIDGMSYHADLKDSNDIATMKDVKDGDTIEFHSILTKSVSAPKRITVNSFGRQIRIIYSDDIKLKVLYGDENGDKNDAYGVSVQTKSIKKIIRFNIEFDITFKWDIFKHPQKMVVGIINNKYYHIMKDKYIIKEIDKPKLYGAYNYKDIVYSVHNISGELGVIVHGTINDNNALDTMDLFYFMVDLQTFKEIAGLIIIIKKDNTKVKVANKSPVDFDNENEVTGICELYIDALIK